MDRTYVSQIERAVGNPSLLVLCNPGAILEIDVLDLLAEQTAGEYPTWDVLKNVRR